MPRRRRCAGWSPASSRSARCPSAETYDAARALLPPASDKVAAAYLEQIDAAIADDLATPKMLAALQESLRDTDISAEGLRVVVAAADALLGLGLAGLEVPRWTAAGPPPTSTPRRSRRSSA